MKNVVTVVLLSFVATSVAYLIASESGLGSGSGTAALATPSDADAAQPSVGDEEAISAIHQAREAELVVYYFHGTMRCPTCLTMERYAREAVAEAFGAELNAGIVEWRALDYDDPANEHFVKDYGLTASAIVIESAREVSGGSWRNLERIWELVGDEAAFKAYIVESIRSRLRGES